MRVSQKLCHNALQKIVVAGERVKGGGVWSKIEIEMLAKKLYFYTTQQVQWWWYYVIIQ